MALEATGRLENILASFEKYIQDGLVNTKGVDVAFPGVPFESKGLTSWAELHYLGDLTAQKWRQTGGRRKGREADLVVQVSCYCKKSIPTTGAPVSRRVLYNLRDIVLGQLELGREISIVDYHNGGSTMVDTMQIQGVEDQPFKPSGDLGSAGDSDKELLGWVYTITIRYTELHGAS